MSEPADMSKARWGLGTLQAFIGLNAVVAGAGLIADPSGAMLGMSVELLIDTPFEDFLVPGVVLLALNGLGSFGGAFLTFRRHRRAGAAAVLLGVFLMLWIVAQAIWFPSVSWLHPTLLAFGVLEVALGAGLTAHRRSQDPMPPELKDITPII